MKLISMTNFVIQEWEKDMYTDDFTKIVKNYAYFFTTIRKFFKNRKKTSVSLCLYA